MPWNRDRRSLMQQASAEGFRGPDATRSTFGDTYPAFLAKTINSELTISSYLMDAPKRDRNDRIDQMIKEGEIDEEAVDQFRTHRPGRINRIDYDGLSDFLAESGMADVQTTGEINEQIEDFVHFFEDQAADIASRSSASGVLGQFLGSMHAGFLDPVNIAASFAIPAAGPAATVWRTAAQQAKAGVGAAVLAESFIQPVVHEYKNSLGLDYTFSDALTNASLSAILGGTVSGAAGALGKQIQLTSEARANPGRTTDEVEAYDQAIEVARQMEAEYRNAPEQDITPQAFDRNVGEAGDSIDNGVNSRPVADVEPIDVDAAIRANDEDGLRALEEEMMEIEADFEALQSSERGGAPLSQDGTISSAQARFDELEGKMAIAMTCLKG